MAIAGCAIGPCGGFCGATGGTSCALWLQKSEMAAGLLARHGINSPDAGIRPCHDSGCLEFRRPGRSEYWRGRRRFWALLAELPRPWPRSQPALGWIPRPLRDLGYRLIARWRYRIWDGWKLPRSYSLKSESGFSLGHSPKPWQKCC